MMGLRERVAVLGGADPVDPLEPSNGVRHAAVGALIACVAAWAWAATTGMFRSNLKVPWPVAIFAGLLIAVIIFCIDVLITCTPLQEDKPRYRARIILIRGMISLAMGLVISHATILVMYRDALAQIVSNKNQLVAQADASYIRSHSQWSTAITGAQGEIASDRTQIQAADSSYARDRAALARTRTAWLNDRLCVNGGQRAANGDWCGNGNVANPLRRAYKKLYNNFPAVQRSHDETVARLTADITALTNTVTADRNRLNAQIRAGTQADLANTGLAAQSEALWTLLRRDAFLWLWPVFFIVIDLAVALMKGILPESDFDRRRRRERERDDKVNEMVTASPVWRQVAVHTADRLAEVATARADVMADRQIATLQSRHAPPPRRSRTAPAAQQHWPRRKKLTWASLSASLVITAVLTVTASLVQRPGQPVNFPLIAVGGQSIQLQGGEKLTIPVGAISGNAPVTASYTAAQGWPGNTPVSAQVQFTTTGTVIGTPELSLHIPVGERQLALTGAIHLAFKSPSSGEWTPYPATFNAETDMLIADLAHFSTYRFWESNSASDVAHMSQSLSEWKARRASEIAGCSTNPGCRPGIDPAPGSATAPPSLSAAASTGTQARFST